MRSFHSSVIKTGRFVWFTLFTLAFVVSANAQTRFGGIRGTVSDQTGAVIVGASIEVKSDDTKAIQKTTTGNNGQYYVSDLTPGKYELQIASQFFQTTKIVNVDVVLGQTLTLDVNLKIKNSIICILNFGDLIYLDTTSAVVGNQVSDKQIQDIPLANRSFANIAYIAPMTAPVEPSDPTKARITAVSFAGSSGLNLDISVDGADNNDDYIGGFLQNYSPEAVQEFNVRTAQFDADTSRTNGGSVLIATKSGSNEFHGSLSYFGRSSAMNARNTLDNPDPDPKQPFNRQDFVSTIGGPIVKDRLWFFNSFGYIDENASVAYSANSSSEFTALSKLASTGQIPGVTSISVPTSTPIPFRDLNSNTRLDWRQSNSSQWFLRFSINRNNTKNDLVQQGSLPSTGFTTNSNYHDFVISNQWVINPNLFASMVFDGGYFFHNKVRNSNIGLALSFPFSLTTLTTSGFETFGDNQFITGITAFPIERDQEKYQFRFDISRRVSSHDVKYGINVIHEPVLRGRQSDSAETLVTLPENPSFYIANPGTFAADFAANSIINPAGNGTFSQSIRRLGIYLQDAWRVTPHFTVNYGVRYDTTFGLLIASGHNQNSNPALLALRSLGVAFAKDVPHDYRKAIAPRLGIAWAPGSGHTVFRVGGGMYYNDLSQNGWVDAFHAVNGDLNSPSAIIDPNYHTPYAIQASAAVEHDFSGSWRLGAQFEHQQGVHQYRRYEYTAGYSLPTAASDTSVFKTDNRSRYDGVSVILQHHKQKMDLTAHYTFAKASTYGATVGELFDYVNGVRDALNPFGPGDHGPSGEDIRHRLVISGVFELPGKFQLSTLAQFESARPYTMFTPFDVTGDGISTNDRAVVNGKQTTLDQFRGAPFNQVDVRISRDFKLGEHAHFRPFIEMFNVYNRINPGNNFIPDISALPTPVNDITNATAFCLNTACTQTRAIKSINDLRVPAGALGDFFGPGTTVGNPFAAQLGFRLTF